MPGLAAAILISCKILIPAPTMGAWRIQNSLLSQGEIIMAEKQIDRRDFVKGGSALVAGAVLAPNPGRGALRLGLSTPSPRATRRL